jgi:urea carboxylase
MLHDNLRFYPGGDRAIEVELGDEMDFTINFIVHRLAAAVRGAKISGLVDLIPELASFQVNYDPDRISYEDLCREIEALYSEMGRGVTGALESRLITIPVLYFDEKTDACIEAYRKQYPEKVPDPELICKLNGLPDRSALRHRHASTEYWVAALGFWPGLCSLLALNPNARLIAPKYDPPRTQTPKGAVGLGGALTCIYPDETPGGYQLIGHTPAPTYDGAQRLPDFTNSLALFRAGDRVRFKPVEIDECRDIEARVAEGSFRHDIVDYQVFSVNLYLSWAKSQEEAAV